MNKLKDQATNGVYLDNRTSFFMTAAVGSGLGIFQN